MRRSRHLLLSLLMLPLLVFFGCSDGSVDPANEIVSTTMEGEIPATGTSFSMVIEAASSSNGPLQGPFRLEGSNLHYDSDIGALVVDLTVTNDGIVSHYEPVSLTFLSLLPDGVTIRNADGIEPRPANPTIVFEFANDDAMWTPGEKSFPRTVEFIVDEGVSVGFIARLSVGDRPEPTSGFISGRVWNDINGDGKMDDDEPGLPGVRVCLDNITDDDPDSTNTDPRAIGNILSDDDLRCVATDRDGNFIFDGLDAGVYVVGKMPSDHMNSTTPITIHVLLTELNGEVSYFKLANFGCQVGDTEPPPRPIEVGDYAFAVGRYNEDAGHLVGKRIHIDHCSEERPCGDLRECPCDRVDGAVRGTVSEVSEDGSAFVVMGTEFHTAQVDTAINDHNVDGEGDGDGDHDKKIEKGDHIMFHVRPDSIGRLWADMVHHVDDGSDMVIGPISEVGHISPSDRVVFKVFGIVVFPALEGEPGDH